jgi:hypothetical protein
MTLESYLGGSSMGEYQQTIGRIRPIGPEAQASYKNQLVPELAIPPGQIMPDTRYQRFYLPPDELETAIAKARQKQREARRKLWKQLK